MVSYRMSIRTAGDVILGTLLSLKRDIGGRIEKQPSMPSRCHRLARVRSSQQFRIWQSSRAANAHADMLPRTESFRTEFTAAASGMGGFEGSTPLGNEAAAVKLK